MEKLMALQKYIRQLRPIQENYVDHVEQVQSLLTEATMSTKDFFTKDNKRDNQKIERLTVEGCSNRCSELQR